MTASPGTTWNYRPWVRWGVTLAGLAVTAESARRTWGLVMLLKSFGFPGSSAPPEIRFLNGVLLVDAVGTIVVLSLTVWAFFGLKKWAKNLE